MAERNSVITFLAITIAAVTALIALLAIDPPILAERAHGYMMIASRASGVIAAAALIASLSCNGLLLWALKKRKREALSLAAAELGGIRVFPNRGDIGFGHELSASLEAAVRIDAVGLGNNKLTSDASLDFYRSFLVQRRGRLRIMFLNPEGSEISKREDGEHRDRGTLRYAVKHNLEDIRAFIKACTSEDAAVASNVEVRLYDFPPSINTIIIDNTTAFVHYYGVHARGYDAPSMIVTAAHQTLLAWYRSEFESLWQFGQKLDVL